MIKHLIPALLMLSALVAAAGELVVQSRVVDVEPLLQRERIARETGDCDPIRPAGDDLAALLTWDLRANCRVSYETRETVTGYRVVHVVDGRRLVQIVDQHPGDTLPVRLTLH